MVRATLVATLLDPPSSGGENLLALPDTVEWLEVRADLVGDYDVEWLRRHFGGRLIYSLRSHAEGGNAPDCFDQRHERLLAATAHYDLIELEGERDLIPELLSAIPSWQRLISWHGPAVELEELRAKCDRFSSVEARFYKFVPTAKTPGDELVPLSLLKSLSRSDVIAYASGPVGFWSRLVAPLLGAHYIFGAVGPRPEISGEPSLTRLIEDYGLPVMMTWKEIYGIVGNPVSHSLSPRLHNAAYRALGYPALFVPFHVESFNNFWWKVVESEALKSLDICIKGLTVASPYKETALDFAAKSSVMVKRAGATNICVRSNGVWEADTTDPEGVVAALGERGIDVVDKEAAVIGCGGAGRAVAAALSNAGARVTLVNRGQERGQLAVRLLGLPFVPLSNFTPKGYAIVVNATPVGRDDGEKPFKVEELSADAVVVDLVYGSKPTPLMANALERGNVVIDGREVLLTQVRRQFRLMIGRKMPTGLAAEVLDSHARPPDVLPTELPGAQTSRESYQEGK